MELKTIDSLKECSALIMAHMKRGVITNSFSSTRQLESEIKEGRLAYIADKESLFLLKKRESFHIMSYYLLGEENDIPRFDFPLVTEIAFRNAGQLTEGDKSIISKLKKAGFEELLTRVKLERLPRDTDCRQSTAVRLAHKQDCPTVQRVLRDNLPVLTGCIPTITELSVDIDNGNVLVAKCEDSIVAVLRIESGKSTAEIKQLAVDKDHRGQGNAKALLDSFIAMCGDKKIFVWTGAENHTAIRLYERAGFEIVSQGSVVLGKGI